MKTLNVTCAIILRDDKVLVVQRSEKMKLPLKWEFPGGKVEIGESDEECLHREIMEELGIQIDIIKSLKPSIYKYDSTPIKLIPFICNFKNGKIKLAEHYQFLWLLKSELSTLNWAEADIPILNEFLSL
jgi:ADP-ribose pyrophosphatase